jgi:hypothetical protein
MSHRPFNEIPVPSVVPSGPPFEVPEGLADHAEDLLHDYEWSVHNGSPRGLENQTKYTLFYPFVLQGPSRRSRGDYPKAPQKALWIVPPVQWARTPAGKAKLFLAPAKAMFDLPLLKEAAFPNEEFSANALDKMQMRVLWSLTRGKVPGPPSPYPWWVSLHYYRKDLLKAYVGKWPRGTDIYRRRAYARLAKNDFQSSIHEIPLPDKASRRLNDMTANPWHYRTTAHMQGVAFWLSLLRVFGTLPFSPVAWGLETDLSGRAQGYRWRTSGLYSLHDRRSTVEDWLRIRSEFQVRPSQTLSHQALALILAVPEFIRNHPDRVFTSLDGEGPVEQVPTGLLTVPPSPRHFLPDVFTPTSNVTFPYNERFTMVKSKERAEKLLFWFEHAVLNPCLSSYGNQTFSLNAPFDGQTSPD